MFLANFFGGGFVLLLGCIFRVHDAYDGLSGFSTMSEKEKAKWDMISAGRFIAWLMIISGAIVVAGGVLILMNFMPILFMAVSWGLFCVILIAGVIYRKVSKRFQRIS